MRARAAAIAVALACAWPVAARAGSDGSAVVLPPLSSHVMDLAGALPEADILALDADLEAYRQRSGHGIVAVVAPSLGGEPIEDFAYRAFNFWQIGDAREDDGVLLVVVPADRRVRIETGKGVGGALTDLQANDILKTAVEPPLAAGQVQKALVDGTARIEAALDADDATSGHVRPRAPTGAGDSGGGGLGWVLLGLGGIAGLLLACYAAIPGSRGAIRVGLGVLFQIVRVLLWFVTFGRGGGVSAGGGGGGSGYSGGGGHSGGGGSSDSY